MGKQINKQAKTFEEYREGLLNIAENYYPHIFNELDDASVASFFVDINASIGENLINHLDKVYQETQLDYAQQRKSLLSIARSCGIKIPGKNASLVSVAFTCELPVSGEGPDWDYAPLIPRGTIVTNGDASFYINEDVDFAQQYNLNGVSDRTEIKYNSQTQRYSVTKVAIAYNGANKTYTTKVTSSMYKPFMSIYLPDANVLSIESIIVNDSEATPSDQEFYREMEEGELSDNRWWEVDSLAETEVFAQETSIENLEDGDTRHVCSGDWKTTNQKFITEYTDKGYLKITFGGYDETNGIKGVETAKQLIMANIVRNINLGKIPTIGKYIHVRYRVGGGSITNIGRNSLDTIQRPFAPVFTRKPEASSVRNTVEASIKVTNNTPAIGGRDELSNEDIRHLIKYNTHSQNRCVTIKDYYSRIMLMPSKYGAPYKCVVSEENNKVCVHMLDITPDGKLNSQVSNVMCNNIVNYLRKYKMINDYVTLKPGRILNLEFQVSLAISRYASKKDIISKVINLITDYMSPSKHNMGENIYLSALTSAIYSIEGVKNIVDLSVYNIYGGQNYSQDQTSQHTVATDSSVSTNSSSHKIDLMADDNTLYADANSMFEIKYPNSDIKVRIKYTN